MAKFLDEKEIELNDPPRLEWVLVEDAQRLIWVENPKLHDLGAVIESIVKSGFQEPPKLDMQLENLDGQMGAIKSGNGRTEALVMMEKEKKSKSSKDGYKLPAGMAITKEGKWVMPILIGTDAESQEKAKAYALDSNNITMMGGDANLYDIAGLYNEAEYMALLETLAQANQLPISVTGDDVDMLFGSTPNLDDLATQFGEPQEQDFWPVINVKVSPEAKRIYDHFIETSEGEEEGEKFGNFLLKIWEGE